MSHALGLPSCMLAYDFLSENRNTIYVSCRDKDPRPSGGFMGYFRNQPHNLHMAGATMTMTMTMKWKLLLMFLKNIVILLLLFVLHTFLSTSHAMVYKNLFTS